MNSAINSNFISSFFLCVLCVLCGCFFRYRRRNTADAELIHPGSRISWIEIFLERL